MQYKGYFGTVEYDPDAKILHGQVAGLRDVITFQADSVSGIEKAFRDSINDYLAFCRQRGESPEKPHSGQLVVRIGSTLHRSLAAIAQTTGKSLNSIIKESLQREVEQAISETPAAKSTTRRKSA